MTPRTVHVGWIILGSILIWARRRANQAEAPPRHDLPHRKTVARHALRAQGRPGQPGQHLRLQAPTYPNRFVIDDLVDRAAVLVLALAAVAELRAGERVDRSGLGALAVTAPSFVADSGPTSTQPNAGSARAALLRLSFLSPQSFVCVFDQQVTDRKPTALGFGGESVSQLGGDDHRATDVVVALPHIVRRLRQALSSLRQSAATAGQAGRTVAECGRSRGRGSSGWGSPAPARARRAPADAVAD